MLLYSRLLHAQPDQQRALAVTLDQAMNALQAAGGDIWLMDENGRLRLEVSTFSTPATDFEHYNQRSRAAHWIVETRAPQRIEEYLEGYSGIGIPLLYSDKLLGVLVVYNETGIPFDETAQGFLEDFALLATPMIASLQARERLQAHTQQQRVLLEMSHQIADGVEEQEILPRVLEWATRLCPLESGWIGIYRPAKQEFAPVVSWGAIRMPESGLALQDCRLLTEVSREQHHRVFRREEALRLDADCPHCAQWRPNLRQALYQPLVYRGELMGMLVLVNKLEGIFTPNDIASLDILAKITSIALNNIRLHSYTVDLLHEREQLHQIISQRERLAVIGRLIRSLTHEINNPMQAVRGALSLAQEEARHLPELDAYFAIMRREVDRVIGLLQRMRSLYATNQKPAALELGALLQNVLALAHKELHWQQIRLKTNFAPHPVHVWGESDQLHIALLNLILELGSLIAQHGENTLSVQTRLIDSEVYIILNAPVPLRKWYQLLFEDDDTNISEAGFHLQLSRELIESHRGRVMIREDKDNHSVIIALPQHNNQKAP